MMIGQQLTRTSYFYLWIDNLGDLCGDLHKEIFGWYFMFAAHKPDKKVL